MDKQQENFRLFLEIALLLILVFSAIIIRNSQTNALPVSAQYAEVEAKNMSFTDLAQIIEHNCENNHSPDNSLSKNHYKSDGTT